MFCGKHNFVNLKTFRKIIKDKATELSGAISNLSKLEKQSVKHFEEREAEINSNIEEVELHRKNMVFIAKVDLQQSSKSMLLFSEDLFAEVNICRSSYHKNWICSWSYYRCEFCSGS